MAWNIRYDPSLVAAAVNRAPLTGAFVITGIAPATTEALTRIPLVGSLSVTGKQASVVAPITITVNNGALSVTGIAPSINTGALSITTGATLTAGTQYTPYSQALAATGGTAPYTWTISSGSMNPFGGTVVGVTKAPGLNITFNGNLLAAPLQNAQTDSFVIKVTDSVGATTTKTFGLTTGASSFAYDLEAATNVYANQNTDSTIPGSPRFCVFLDQWGSKTTTSSCFIKGFSERSWVHYAPFAWEGGGIAGFPCVGRGWLKTAGFFAPGSAPLQSAGLQISAITKAKLHYETDIPIDRTNTNYIGFLDTYFHTIAAPNSSGDITTNTDPNNAILNLIIVTSFMDTYGYYEQRMNHNQSYTAPSYANRIELDGKMWFYVIDNNGFCANPPIQGAGYYNTVTLFPAPWNDCQQGGLKIYDLSLKQLFLDLCAADVAGNLKFWNGSSYASGRITISTSSYFSGTFAGWEIEAGGNASPDNRNFYVRDFQLALQSEADPVVAVGPEVPTLISRHVPVDGTAAFGSFPLANAVGANYYQGGCYISSTGSPSAGSPVVFAMDFSGVSSLLKKHGLFHFNGYLFQYYYGAGATGYYIPGDYTIEGNAAGFTAGAAPTTGWVVLTTVTGNVGDTRSHYIGDWSAYNCLRLRCTANSSTSSLAGVGIHVDVYEAPNTTGSPDGWNFIGDSITANDMNAGDGLKGGANEYAGNILSHYTGGKTIPVTRTAIAGWSLTNSAGGHTAMMPWLDGTNGTWMDDCPSRYVWFALVTNDTDGGDPNTFKAGLTTIINRALSLGKTIVVPSMWYSQSDSGANSTTWSGYISTVLATFSGNARVMAGPDLNAIGGAFAANMFDSGDTIHPGVRGESIKRAIQMDWIGRVIYRGEPAASFVPDYSIGTGVGGRS